MPTINVKSLNVIAVYVTDLQRSIHFYTEQLGFEQIQEMSPGVLLKAGDVTLYIEPGRKKRIEEAGVLTEFSPCFATDSVKQSYESLKNAGVKIVADYQEFGPTFAFFQFADPDYNLIEIAGNP